MPSSIAMKALFRRPSINTSRISLTPFISNFGDKYVKLTGIPVLTLTRHFSSQNSSDISSQNAPDIKSEKSEAVSDSKSPSQIGETNQNPALDNNSDNMTSKTIIPKNSPHPNINIQTNYYLDFGKNRGQLLETIPSEYCRWLVNKGAHLQKPELSHALEKLGYDVTTTQSSWQQGENGPNDGTNYTSKWSNGGGSQGGFNGSNKFNGSGPGSDSNSKYPDSNVTANYVCTSCGAKQQVNVSVNAVLAAARQQRAGNSKFQKKPYVNPQELWSKLKQDASEWMDCRENKPSQNYPDFKHVDSGAGLWINSRNTPEWVNSTKWDEMGFKKFV